MRKAGIVRPRLAALAGDSRGVGALELALVAPLLAIMLIGIVDLSRGFAARASLEQAAYRTLERVTVGGAQDDYAYLQAEAAQAAAVPVDQVTVEKWLECDTVRQPDYDTPCAPAQMMSRYVQVTIRSTYQPSFRYGPLAGTFGQGADGGVAIRAVAAVRIG